MYRALPVARRTLHPPAATAAKLRQFASSAEPTPKKSHFIRNTFLYTAGLLIAFYGASPVLAFNNERYRDFFSESVPLGQVLLEYGEENGWEDKLIVPFIKNLTKPKLEKKVDTAIQRTSDVVAAAGEKVKQVKENATVLKKENISEKVSAAKAATSEKIHETKERTKEIASAILTQKEKTPPLSKSTSPSVAEKVVEKAVEAKAAVQAVEANTKAAAIQFSEGVEDLVRQAEAALSGQPSPTEAPVASEPSSDKVASSSTLSKVYTAELPIGFEPPPGYVKPKPAAPSKTEEKLSPSPLPLLTPVVVELGPSEPVIKELASTIDQLTSFLNANPESAGSAKSVVDAAKVELSELTTRFQQIKKDEEEQLIAKLDEQAREYNLKLLELEMQAQDKLDEQEQEFKGFYQEEKRRFALAYREKLENELRAQSEIINERLKEEVIAQGIELQRRWIREVKVRVEQERGGRLSKLDELAANLKRLERITLDNSVYLDENLRLHALWSALRALHAAVDSPVRKPFREELRVLRHVAAAKNDPIISAVLDTLESTDVPDVGVEPLAALSSWYATSVVPQVKRVALVPEQNAGLVSYLASYALTSLQFTREGNVEGSDVLSVLSRAAYYMNEKDLDRAARELNQLRGVPKELLADWLAAARRRLEVLQAIQLVESQATLSSLLVV